LGEFAVGQGVQRFKDPRLLKGLGRQVDDLVLPRRAFGPCAARASRPRPDQRLAGRNPPVHAGRSVNERFMKAGSQVAYLDRPDFARFLGPIAIGCSSRCARSACQSGVAFAGQS
jgi:hypothetical protein